MQNHYNLLYREEEREMIRFCRQTGVGLIPACTASIDPMSNFLTFTVGTLCKWEASSVSRPEEAVNALVHLEEWSSV